MCGIAGIVLDKKAIRNNVKHDVGALLVEMSSSQQIRGQDSFGIALFGRQKKDYSIVAVSDGKEVSGILEKEPNKRMALEGSCLYAEEFNVDSPSDAVKRILKMKDAWMMSHGYSLTILKELGLVRHLAGKWFEADERLRKIVAEGDKNRQWNDIRYATHGLAHVRIATSSAVTPKHAHPFCCANVGDIAVVHNGEVTNAARIRKELSLKKYALYSDNDTETIAGFIGNRISRAGIGLKEACEEFISVASGFYSCLIATPSEVAFVKDIASTRPALFGYHPEDENLPGFHAIATDISALAAVGAVNDIGTVEPGGVKVFSTGLEYRPFKIQG